MTDELLLSRAGSLGAIRLNRPEALNSLTHEMVQAFLGGLKEFAADSSIVAVLVTGAGERAFCAGGDIRRLYEERGGNGAYYKQFWRDEYRLNACIASFPKPYVVVMDGLVMGGGVGVSAHGNRRLVTERTRLAMPETGIGFIPDVGGTWLLTRKGGAGVYMALAGVTVGAADAMYAGLADTLIDSAAIDELTHRLSDVREPCDVDCVLSDFARTPPQASLAENGEIFEGAIRHARIEEFVAALDQNNSQFAQKAVAEIGTKSPTSLKVTFALLKEAKTADRLESCLVSEFRAACSLLQSHDLFEGIRAAIIDKDRRPRWSPARLDTVDATMVAAILKGTGVSEPDFSPWSEPPYGRLT